MSARLLRLIGDGPRVGRLVIRLCCWVLLFVVGVLLKEARSVV